MSKNRPSVDVSSKTEANEIDPPFKKKFKAI